MPEIPTRKKRQAYIPQHLMPTENDIGRLIYWNYGGNTKYTIKAYEHRDEKVDIIHCSDNRMQQHTFEVDECKLI